MPFVTPLPLNGFGRELANMGERVRAVEQERASATFLSVTYPTAVVSSTSWATPTGWGTSLSFNLDTTAGALILYGAYIEPKVPVDGNDVVWVQVTINGSVLDNTSGTSGTIGQPLAAADGVMSDIVQLPDGILYNRSQIMPFGAYTLALEAHCGDVGQSYTLRGGYVAVWII